MCLLYLPIIEYVFYDTMNTVKCHIGKNCRLTVNFFLRLALLLIAHHCTTLPKIILLYFIMERLHVHILLIHIIHFHNLNERYVKQNNVNKFGLPIRVQT